MQITINPATGKVSGRATVVRKAAKKAAKHKEKSRGDSTHSSDPKRHS